MTELYKHQIESLEIIENENKGFFNIICGGGKTRIMKEACMKYRLCAIFAPSKTLVDQITSVFSDTDFNIIKINSDNKIKKIIKNKKNLFIVNYQSVHTFVEYLDSNNIELDITFFDEAHNCTSESRQNIFNDDNDDGLMHLSMEIDGDDFNIPTSKLFFMTATPNQEMYENPDIFGEELLKYSFKEGVEDKVIKNFDTVIHCYKPSYIDEKKYNSYEYLLKSINDLVYEKNLKRIIVYTALVNDGNTDKRITISNIKKNKKHFDKNFELHFITGKTTKNDRNAILEEFKNKKENIQIIISCKTISEGIDIVACDSVVILDYSNSITLNVQRALRCCRLSNQEDYKNSVVYYPVNISTKEFCEFEQAENKTEFLNSKIDETPYKYPMVIVNFLKNNLSMELLFEYKIKKIKESSNNSNNPNNSNDICIYNNQKTLMKINYNLNNDYDISFKDCDFDEKMKFMNIRMELTYNEEKWDIRYNEVKKFIVENNKNPSQRAKNKEEKSLGTWISRQKRNYKKNQLSGEKINQLELINGWVWENDLDEKWNSRYNEVKKFVVENNKHPSFSSKNKGEKSLYNWISNQKASYKKNELTKERIEKLELIDKWIWENDLDELWNIRYNELKKFVVENNKHPSFSSKNKGEKSLGTWISTQKGYYKKNELTQEKIEKLELIDGWVWGNDELWNSRYNEVKKFILENNRHPSISSKNKEEKSLGSWISNQKTNYKKNELTKERIEKLELIDKWVWENDLDEKWNSRYNEVKKFVVENNKHPSKRAENKEEKSLGTWISKQKVNYKKNQLSEDRIKELELINGWAWTGKNVVKSIDKYKDMTNEELIEKLKILENQNKTGIYKAPNTGYKERINKIFNDNIKTIEKEGHIILLDTEEFNSSNEILDGKYISNLVIPQRDKETYNEMRKNKKYRNCVKYMTLEELLNKYIESQEKISLIYADLMGCLITEKKHIEQLKKCNLSDNCLIGLTISRRSHEKSQYTNQCVTEMNDYFHEKFSCKKISTEVYGENNPMATSIFQICKNRI